MAVAAVSFFCRSQIQSANMPELLLVLKLKWIFILQNPLYMPFPLYGGIPS